MDAQNEKYERCFIATVFEYADKKFKTQIQFARELWPDKTDANVSTRIREIRESNSRGKPQGLKMSDACSFQCFANLCHGLAPKSTPNAPKSDSYVRSFPSGMMFP